MELARLVLEYLQALVWPSVVVFLALVFKKDAQTILHRLKSAKLPGGVSLDLSEQIREAKNLSDKVQEAASEKIQEHKGKPSIPLTDANARLLKLGLQPSPSGMDMTYYRDIAAKDPNLALAGLRIDVDILSRNLARGFKVEIGERDTAGRIARRLLEEEAIDHYQFELLSKILAISNQAVHGTPISYDQAQSVLDSAQVLIDDYIAWMSWGFDDGWQPQ